MNRFLLIFIFWATACMGAYAQVMSWISDCSDKSFCLNQGSCTTGTVLMTEKAVTNSCGNQSINYSYKIDLNNDGSTDIQVSNDSVSGQFAKGTHKISWRATDNCGHLINCTYLFTIKDCQPPNMVCINGLTQSLDPPVCEETFIASTFILSYSDNCTPNNQIQIGMRETGTGTDFPTATSITFDECDQGLRLLEIWIRDGNGLTNQCNTYVLVQPGTGGCECNLDGDVHLGGCVQTQNNKKISEYHINATLQSVAGVQTPISKTISKNLTDSCYTGSFGQLPFGGSYKVVVGANRTDNAINGVSTFDLVLISKHILSLEPFQNIYQAIAADVNKSNSVTTFDIVEARKLILGIYDSFPGVPSWRFVQPVANPTNLNIPLSSIKDTFEMNLSGITGDFTFNNLGFVAVKVGDINLNAVNVAGESEDRSNLPPLRFAADRVEAFRGEEAVLPFRTSEDLSLEGWQTAFRIDPEMMELLDIEGIDPENYTLSPDGQLRLLWFDGRGQHFAKGSVLFSLRVRMRADGLVSQGLSLDAAGIRSEAYMNAGQTQRHPLEVALPASTLNDLMTVRAPFPNPFSQETRYQIYLPQAAQVRFELFDNSGSKLMYSEDRLMDAGLNEWVLRANDIPTAGVYTYRIVAGSEVVTGKVVKM